MPRFKQGAPSALGMSVSLNTRNGGRHLGGVGCPPTTCEVVPTLKVHSQKHIEYTILPLYLYTLYMYIYIYMCIIPIYTLPYTKYTICICNIYIYMICNILSSIYIYTYIHTHTHIYIYIYMYICFLGTPPFRRLPVSSTKRK